MSWGQRKAQPGEYRWEPWRTPRRPVAKRKAVVIYKPWPQGRAEAPTGPVQRLPEPGYMDMGRNAELAGLEAACSILRAARKAVQTPAVRDKLKSAQAHLAARAIALFAGKFNKEDTE